jgi:hypothetical protein
VSHAIFLVIGAFVFLLLVGIAPVTGDLEPMWILTLVGTSVGLLMAAWGCRGCWPAMAIVVGILSLVNFPVGTAIGIYTVWVLMQPTATEYFSEL